MVAADYQKVIMQGFVDFHCHLIPGVDDGPTAMDESLAIASVLESLGFTHVYCTPHFLKGSCSNHPEQIKAATGNLQDALTDNKIPITVRHAVEYYLDEFLLDSLDCPIPIWENVILMEAHRFVQPRVLADTAYRIIVTKRLRPLIAHPERYEFLRTFGASSRGQGLLPVFFSRLRAFVHGPKNYAFLSDADEANTLNRLRDMGCLFQGNIGSFAGIYGKNVQKRALNLLREGFYDCLGTDAHKQFELGSWLQKGMKRIEREIGREGLTRLLSPFE